MHQNIFLKLWYWLTDIDFPYRKSGVNFGVHFNNTMKPTRPPASYQDACRMPRLQMRPGAAAWETRWTNYLSPITLRHVRRLRTLNRRGACRPSTFLCSKVNSSLDRRRPGKSDTRRRKGTHRKLNTHRRCRQRVFPRNSPCACVAVEFFMRPRSKMTLEKNRANQRVLWSATNAAWSVELSDYLLQTDMSIAQNKHTTCVKVSPCNRKFLPRPGGPWSYE